ncbi:MAG: serine/threonine-protein phosphatase [Gammaproteobacteria bacterium]|nr:serine/threonine-protein phosphatase [Gammaproteobacteria bacterium]NIX01751.1 SpoIIE family protein phosphatase [Phycisphaerae bacterium]
MYRIQCAEIWGGIRDLEQDVCSSGVRASLYSSACEGCKGGDIYYLSVCESDKLTRIAVADVLGHGEAVSEYSQFIYDALKLYMNEPVDAKVLTEVNRHALSRGLKAMTTAAIVSFYRSTSHLCFTYAGHYPVLVKRKRDHNWLDAMVKEPDDADRFDTNLPLAVKSNAVFVQENMPLAKGDRLFLYTDGIIEAPDHSDDLFGIDRLRDVLEDQANAPLHELRDSVLDSLIKHTGGDLRHDDVTFLAVEIL